MSKLFAIDKVQLLIETYLQINFIFNSIIFYNNSDNQKF